MLSLLRGKGPRKQAQPFPRKVTARDAKTLKVIEKAVKSSGIQVVGSAEMAQSLSSIVSADKVVEKEREKYLEMCDKINESGEMMSVSKI